MILNLLTDILKYVGGIFKNTFILVAIAFLLWVAINKDSARNLATQVHQTLFNPQTKEQILHLENY